MLEKQGAAEQADFEGSAALGQTVEQAVAAGPARWDGIERETCRFDQTSELCTVECGFEFELFGGV